MDSSSPNSRRSRPATCSGESCSMQLVLHPRPQGRARRCSSVWAAVDAAASTDAPARLGPHQAITPPVSAASLRRNSRDTVEAPGPAVSRSPAPTTSPRQAGRSRSGPHGTDSGRFPEDRSRSPRQLRAATASPPPRHAQQGRRRRTELPPRQQLKRRSPHRHEYVTPHLHHRCCDDPSNLGCVRFCRRRARPGRVVYEWSVGRPH